MKTQLILDYQNSKAFQYYLYLLGKLKFDEDVSDADLVCFFGFDDRSVSKDYLLDEAHPYIARNIGYENLLMELTLFDEIRIMPCEDSYSSKHKAVLIDGKELQDMGITYKKRFSRPSDELIKETIKLFKMYRSDIIRAVNMDDSFRRLGYVAEECHIFEMYIENKMYIDALEEYSPKTFGQHINDFLDSIGIPDFSGISRMRDWWDAESFHYELYLDKVFLHIYDVLSSKNAYSFSNTFRIPSSGHGVTKIDWKKYNDSIDTCVAQLHYNKGAFMLPQPETIQDVIYLRNEPNMISFRKVYSQWIAAIQKGDMVATEKIWNDVLDAKSAIDKINKFKKVNDNSLVRTLLTTAGLVPYLSYVISAYGFISATIVNHIEKKYRWCNVAGLSEDYDYYNRSGDVNSENDVV